MNKVFLIGNLTKDPELTETPNGIYVCHFSIAVTRRYLVAGEKKTDFFNCTAWRGLGETIAQYKKKGEKIAVTGSIELRNYDGSDGIKRTAVDIVVSDVEFMPVRNKPTNEELSSAGYKQTWDEDDIPF